jgi:IS605 OrfB family transposase
MNRIYQGRISKVEIPKPGDKDNPWQPLADWQDKLWLHHELFQDAVNYYTICLLALASSEINPLTKIRLRIEATAGEPENEHHVWTKVSRKGSIRLGLRDAVAKYLTPEHMLSTPQECFAAVLKGNETSAEVLDLALLLLLTKTNGDSSIQKNGNSYAPRFYRPSNKPKWDFSASSVQASAGRSAFITELHSNGADWDAIAEKYGLENVVSLQPSADLLKGQAAQQRLADSLNWMLKASKGEHPKNVNEPLNKAQHWLANQTGCVELIQTALDTVGSMELEIPPNRGGNINLDQLHGFTVFKYAPSVRSIAAGFLRTVLPPIKPAAVKKAANEDTDETESDLLSFVKEQCIKLGDDPISLARGNRGFVFRAFTSLQRWQVSDSNNHEPAWPEFDIAAFKYALTTLHQIEVKARERKEKKQKIDERLCAMRDAGIRASWKVAAEFESDDRPPLLAGDERITRLEAALASLPVVQDLCDVEGQAPEYGLLPRTIRGFAELSERWNKLPEIKQASSPTAGLRDKVLIPELNAFQKENIETIGSVALFRALAEPDNWIVWKKPDAETQAQRKADGFADDPLEALTEERELQSESRRLVEAIRFTPADPIYSRRQFDFKATVGSAFPTKQFFHEQNALQVSVPLALCGTDGKIAPQRVRLCYTAPRLLRDGLRKTENEPLDKEPWSQPMMEALGLKQEAVQQFTDCPIALMPEQLSDGERRFLLNFPVTLDPLAVQRTVFKSAGREHLFATRYDARDKKTVFMSYWKQQCAGMDDKLFYLRWPANKWPAEKEKEAWYHRLSGFQCVSVDLGQRDAGAWALIEAKDTTDFGQTKKGSRPSRQIGNAGGKNWYAAVRATGMFKLPGEDALVRRHRTALDDLNPHDKEQGLAEREEFHGEGGRSATEQEWQDSQAFCERLGFDPAAVLGKDRNGKSFPELNDDLLFVLRRAQSRLARWQRWSWMVQDKARQKEVLAEIVDAKDTPQAWVEVTKQMPVLVETMKSGVLNLREMLCRELEFIANRILPLRGRKWEWVARADRPDCRVLRETETGTDTADKKLRGQRGLSLKRIQQLAELRRRCQSLNRSLQHMPGNRSQNGASRRGIELPDPCPDILMKTDHIKEQRIHQLAHDILAQALGLKLRAHQADKNKRNEHDRHGEYERIPGRTPVDFIVIEDLEFYATTQRRSKSENAKLMMWSRRELRKKLLELCETYGLPVVETSPDYTSKFDARSGGPGFRAAEITPDSRKEPRWRKTLDRWERHLKGEKISDPKSKREHQRAAEVFTMLDAANSGRRSSDNRNPWRTLFVPQRGGTLFISAFGNGGPVQADINAAINLGLRAIAAPDCHEIHLRVRLDCEAEEYRPRRKSKREEARWKGVPKSVAFAFTKEPPSGLSDVFADLSSGADYDDCYLPGLTLRFAGGRGFWDTVNKLEWKRCLALNAMRLRKWGLEPPKDWETFRNPEQVDLDKEDDVPMQFT